MHYNFFAYQPELSIKAFRSTFCCHLNCVFTISMINSSFSSSEIVCSPLNSQILINVDITRPFVCSFLVYMIS